MPEANDDSGRRKKHLLLIHGRSTKPTHEQTRALVRRALGHGLARIDPEAAQRFESGDVAFSFVYYGDLNNEIMIRARPERLERMQREAGGYFEFPEPFRERLETLLARPTEAHTREAYRDLLAASPNRAPLDRVVAALGPMASLLRLTVWGARHLFPDLSAYFTSRRFASEIRYRLQKPLREALMRGEDVALISHSMGCIVAYDVLWKLSHMREYEDVHREKLALWLTLGSPLADPAVRRALYDSNERRDGRYPINIREWINVCAFGDYISRRHSASRAFAPMIEWGRVHRIDDLPRIYNFWVGRNGSNPHKIYGYLNHPRVAERVAEWIRR